MTMRRMRLLHEAVQRSEHTKAKRRLQALNQMLVPFAYKKQAQTAYAEVVRSGKDALAKLSRETAEFLLHPPTGGTRGSQRR